MLHDKRIVKRDVNEKDGRKLYNILLPYEHLRCEDAFVLPVIDNHQDRADCERVDSDADNAVKAEAPEPAIEAAEDCTSFGTA